MRVAQWVCVLVLGACAGSSKKESSDPNREEPRGSVPTPTSGETATAETTAAKPPVEESPVVQPAPAPAPCTTLQGTGPYKAPGRPGFDHGMQTTMYCGNSPESWVRADATLDTCSGVLSVTIELETDSVAAGPKGKALITIKGADGRSVIVANSEEIGMGGKPPGKAISRRFSSRVDVAPGIAQKGQSLAVEAQCTGSSTGWFGIDLNEAIKAFKIIVTVLSA